MKEKVAIKRVENIFNDLKEAIELTGGFDVTDDDFIVIKPNLCDFRPSWEGGTTDPKIVEAFIEIIREKANPRIAIVESNHAVGDADDEFERMGYTELAENIGVDLVNLSKDKRYEVALEGYFFETLEVPETLLRATKIISIAKLKTHAQQKITCSMKNLFGLLPRKAKAKYHPFMNEVLADLNEFYKPSLCIIDGIVGMEGFGPSDGDKKEVGIIICGRNPVAVDAVAARIMGFYPRGVPNLRFAEKRGSGTIRNIEVIEDADSAERFEFIPFYSYWAYRVAFFLSRVGYRINNLLEGFSSFISQMGVGFIVLRRGYFFIPDFGVLYRKDAWRYAKGLVMRVVIGVRLKIMWV
jgi:uncharacterized protein (DUF362 family)